MKHKIRLWLRGLFHVKQSERELEAEVKFDLQQRIEAKMAAGMKREDAENAARREFGSTDLAKEECRDERGTRWLEDLWQDVRFGLRMLRKNPGFTAVAVLTLALGIGASSAVFSVVNSVLLQSLPYGHEDRLVMIWETNPRHSNDHNVVGPANFLSWQDHNTVFDQMAAFADTTMTMTGEGEPEEIPTQIVSASLFSVLGISPLQGRDFTKDEGQKDHNRVILLGYGLWQRRFGGDRNAIGKSILLDGVKFQVIGVMPPNVTLFAPKGTLTGKVAELWFPIGWSEKHRSPNGRWMTAVARLKPGVTLQQAQTEMSGLAAELSKTYPQFDTGWGVNLVPVHQDMVSNIRPVLLVLLAAVGFVLLIACANVANLLLSRGASRMRERAVRRALGATRWRIARQSLTESVVLSMIGGTLGILAAFWAVSVLVLLIPKDLHVTSVTLDWRIVAFAVGISALTGLLFGLAPAFDAARAHISEALREGGRGETGSRNHRLRNIFAIAQISLSLVLLAGAGLLIRSFVRLSSVDPGFNSRNIAMFRIDLPTKKYSKDEQYIDFFQRLLDQVRALPGVQAATTDNSFPLRGMTPGTGFNIVGKPPTLPGQDHVTEVQMVGTDFFRTMGIRLLRGRTFSDREETVESHVVIVSEGLAEQFFPGEDALGQSVVIDMKDKNEPCQIIGIVADVKRAGLDISPVAMSYWPNPELPFSSLMVALRTDSAPLAKINDVREIVRRMDANLPLSDVGTMDQSMGDSVARQRFSAMLVGIFAAIALFLAAIGIYGVVAQAVSLRTREFGIRITLGAQRRDVWWLVFRYGAALAGIGVAIGIVGTLALTQLIRSLLFNVSPYDPAAIASVSLILSGVVLAACWIPARRATRVDPMAALRSE